VDASGNDPYTNVFVNRESGAVCHVLEVNDSHALLSIENPAKGTQPAHQSKYSMPIAEYDGAPGVPVGRWFASIWRPATPDDFRGPVGPNIRPPLNSIADPRPKPPEPDREPLEYDL
jgi:hypothetical protein